ncbi:MAG: EAL domain-containing protein [Legionella sp.]|jgi:diguanylate cyclase (GGDEF)-like protein/PAS domain S-box-containing protein|nr:EAL domain-containing protein [Legionella sp.]
MLPTPTINLKPKEIGDVGIDIDDFNEIETRFDALEKELEYLYGHALFGMHTLDERGVFVSINAQELTWLGYKQQEVIGQLKFIDVLTAESREHYISHIENQLKTGITQDIDLALISNTQVIKHVTLYVTPVLDSDGELIKHRAVLFNIDERKSIEKQLKIATTAFEFQQGVIVTDANCIILQVNHAFTRITGYAAEDVIGQVPRLLNSGVQENTFYNDMWQSVTNTGSWEGEVFNRRKDGNVYTECSTITAVKDSHDVVINYVVTLTDICLGRDTLDEIKSFEFYDSLTQLPNRRLFLDRLNQALILSERSGLYGALLFLDLDQFKTLNDTLGHDIGDLLLEQVAMRLTISMREGDTLARIGGDEFAVLLQNLSEYAVDAAAQTKDVAEKMMATLCQNFQLDTYTYQSTCSIGATLFNRNKLVSDQVLRQADIALYQSKKEGRNTFHFFDPKMQDAINIRADLEQQLRKAIEEQQFELYYQIQVDSLGTPIGAEALIRWIHPERGLIAPVSFISLAEETGQILAIGEWVLNQACLQLKAWQKLEATNEMVLAVNVSAFQFNQTNFVEQVLATVEHHKINPERLKLELTESMLINNIADIITKMEAINTAGIQFSLDDFGTGYSSLQYLKKLPLNQLKIDQSFVHDIVADSSDRAIVCAIINIAHSLDISVIAEGVETVEQRQYLLDNGCAHYQGYLFGKPLPIDEFESLYIKSKSCIAVTH